MTRPTLPLLDAVVTLTPADSQTHRRFPFAVPPECAALRIHASYAPKYLGEPASVLLADAALARQTADLAARVGGRLAADWSARNSQPWNRGNLANLLTFSLDDAAGIYRGSAHRHAPDQSLLLKPTEAAPGLVPGPLPPGEWTLTIHVNTLISAQCVLSIQIGADTASSS